jgi:Flavodoxin domain
LPPHISGRTLQRRETEPAIPDALIFYTSKHGHTDKVAMPHRPHARTQRLATHLHDAEQSTLPVPHDFDAVIVGASIRAGHHRAPARCGTASTTSPRACSCAR